MLLLQKHRAPVCCLAYTADSRLLASAARDSAIVIWDLGTGRVVDRQEYSGAAALAFRADGPSLAAGSDSRGVVWGPNNSRVHFLGARVPIRHLAFTPDGDFLFAAGHLGARDNGVSVWKEEGGPPVTFLADGGCGIAVSGDGRWLASGSPDQRVHLWQRDEDGWTKTSALSGHRRLVRRLAFTADGALVTLAEGFGDEPCELLRWDLDAQRLDHALPTPPGPHFALTMAPDGSLLAWTDPDELLVRVWDVTRCRERAPLDWRRGGVTALAIAPDGMTAAAGGRDGSLVVWDLD